MSLEAARDALQSRVDGKEVDGSVKFVLEGMGALMLSGSSVSIAGDDDAADTTIIADASVFQELMAGELNPTAAVMSGKIEIAGDMGMAMKLGSLLG